MIIQSRGVSNNASDAAESDIDRKVSGYISRATERTQRRFIRTAVVAGLILLLWLWFVSYRSLQDFITATDQHHRALQVLGAGQQLVYLLREAEAGAGGFLILGGESYLVPYYKAQREIPEVIERLQRPKALPAIQQQRFDALGLLIMERMQGLASQIADRRSNDPAVIRQLLDPQTERTMRERIRAIATEILDGAERTLTTKHAAALHNRQRSLYAFVFADVLALAVIASLVLWRERNSRLHDAEALHESEEKFGQVATMTGEWLWEQDAQGRFLYSNGAIKDILGYEADEIRGKSYFDLFTRRDRDRALQFVYSADTKRRFSRLINHYRHKNGYEVITESTGIPLFDANGKIVKWRGVDLDVTVQKRYEEALRESEETFRLTIENTSMGIVTTDLDGHLLMVNQRFCELLGYSAGQLSQMELWDFVHPEDRTAFKQEELWDFVHSEDRAAFKREWQEVASGHKPHCEREQKFIGRDGQGVMLHTRVVAARGAGGQPKLIVGEFGLVY